MKSDRWTRDSIYLRRSQVLSDESEQSNGTHMWNWNYLRELTGGGKSSIKSVEEKHGLLFFC